jgi:structure-specific recognition protein 1
VFIREHYGGSRLDRIAVPISGQGAGELILEGTDGSNKHLSMYMDEKPLFQLPVDTISNAAISGKNELTVEFIPPAEYYRNHVTEIRFQYVPEDIEGASDAESENTGEQPTQHEEDDDDKLLLEEENQKDDQAIDALTELCNQIKEASPLVSLATDVFCTVHELGCLVPRGRFDIDFADDLIRMHGKTYDHRIAYKSINRIFLLPRPDDLHVLFIVGLDPPLKQGQTRYFCCTSNFMQFFCLLAV